VDFFIANSNNVAAKIRKLYGREAAVIYPPVEIERFYLLEEPQPYYLIVSALVPYKKIDIAIEAFNRLKLPLKIAGEGPLRKKLEKIAKPNVEFLGWVDDNSLNRLYASCQALVFPGEEDFGIVPLEAQASGRPVIAYGKGGVRESIVPLGREPLVSEYGPTGILFQEPTAESLIQAVHRFQEAKHAFDQAMIRRHACHFSKERFKREIKNYIAARLADRRAGK
jgi:glycosyltransferase involved in cell wall biosynthesis